MSSLYLALPPQCFVWVSSRKATSSAISNVVMTRVGQNVLARLDVVDVAEIDRVTTYSGPKGFFEKSYKIARTSCGPPTPTKNTTQTINTQICIGGRTGHKSQELPDG
jgi:hypothetical protein